MTEMTLRPERRMRAALQALSDVVQYIENVDAPESQLEALRRAMKRARAAVRAMS